MYSAMDRILAKSYIYTTETEPFLETLNKLLQDLTMDQKYQVEKLLQYKDVFIIEAARSNYEAGFLDGMELFSAVFHRRMQETAQKDI